MSVGIDEISFYTSNYYLDLRTLAEVQQTDPEKYYEGIGQEKMGMAAPDEDVVTMAANAALPLEPLPPQPPLELLRPREQLERLSLGSESPELLPLRPELPTVLVHGETREGEEGRGWMAGCAGVGQHTRTLRRCLVLLNTFSG